MNPNPSERRHPLLNARPHSCEPRFQRPYDHAPGASLARDIPPPQQSPLRSPPGQYRYGFYDQDGGARTQEPLYGGKFTVVDSNQKKCTPRTLQAYEPCRNAKVCTDPKPCQGYIDKEIVWKYDQPTPKQDILGWVEDEIDHMPKRQKSLANALITLHPGVSTILEQPDEVTGGRKMKYEEEDFDTSVREGEMVDSDDGSESQVAGNVLPNEPAIPVGHTTGAAKVLHWPAVVAIMGEKIKKDIYTGIDPLGREIRRGVINLYGTGEGVQRSVGYEEDSMSDHSLDPSSSETYSDTACSSSPKQQSSLIGGQSAVAESYLFIADSDARAAVYLTALRQVDERTVRHLSQSYMRHLNVMHPIITQESLDGMITNFMQQIREPEKTGSASNFSSFISPESVGSKRKRSPTVSSADHPHVNLRRRRKTISEAIVLLIVALGKVCEHETKIPDVVHGNYISTSNPSSNPVSPPLTQQLPPLSSHWSTIPATIMQDEAHQRRSFTDASCNWHSPFKRNLDVIPGLEYFAIAADILGNHAGDMDLPYVHACLLASLYQNQLSRVLQSHVYVKEAGYALTIMLNQRLPRYKQMQKDMGDPAKWNDVEWLPDDNRILFAYWTCLQLECDILAELELPQSGILSLESIMPWPNLSMALQNNELSQMEMQCYLAQLMLRKDLNVIHRELYGPGKENEYQLAKINKLHRIPYVETILENLNKIISTNTMLVWRDGDPPARNILEARLRAKMYGAQVITCRHFLRMVLNSRYEGTGDIEISKPIMDYAIKCIRAMFYSAQAFWGIERGRLVVTNVWGTSHAQWGNAIVLHAAFMHPIFRPHITAHELTNLTERVRAFLVSVAHPSSALADDIRILDYAADCSGARRETFSSTS